MISFEFQIQLQALLGDKFYLFALLGDFYIIPGVPWISGQIKSKLFNEIKFKKIWCKHMGFFLLTKKAQKIVYEWKKCVFYSSQKKLF